MEDDEGDAVLVAEMLSESPEPVQLVHVRSLAAALAEIPRGFGCVLLDLGLPDATGLEVISEVLAAAGGAAVVCLTGSDDVERGAAAVAAGAQDYLVKGSVDPHVLHRALRYAVERRRADEAARQLLASTVRAEENARLERGLLPPLRARFPRIEVTARYRPGRDSLVGGDFYDVLELDDGTLLVLVGDVAGHGPDEAALGVCLRIAWRTLVLAGTDVDRLVPVVEQVLLRERRSDELFATAAMVAVAPDRSSARLWSCGHPAPVLLGSSPRQLDVVEQGLALGLVADEHWTAQRFELGESWQLLLFTDGLVEGHTGPGTDRLGVDGLERVLAARAATHRGTDGELLDAVLADAAALNGGPLTDDVAAVLLTCVRGGA